MHIGIGGHLLSGKSTLAKVLSEDLGFSIVDFRMNNAAIIESYIHDIHSMPTQWSMEAQLAFLVAKVSGIRKLFDSESNFLIDRTVEEDVEVFAKWFYKNKQMSDRSWNTYSRVWEELSPTLPRSAFDIFCHCDHAEMMSRLRKRPRTYQDTYTQEFLTFIRSETNVISMKSKRPTFSLDTSRIDIYSNRTSIVNEIQNIAIEGKAFTPANSLFDELVSDSQFLQFLSPINGRAQYYNPNIQPKKLKKINVNKKRKIYLAAPYTGMAVVTHSIPNINNALFPDEFEVEIIPTGGYRNQLESLALNLQLAGFEVMLPHRDINRWGERKMHQSEVANECLSHVRDSDLIVAMLGTSYGAHVEVGVAIGLGIPVVAISLSDMNKSFFGEGVALSKFTESLNFNSMNELLAYSTEDWSALLDTLLNPNE